MSLLLCRPELYQPIDLLPMRLKREREREREHKENKNTNSTKSKVNIIKGPVNECP